MRLSVVTRTYRRPLLLRRAARSVAGARVADMEWIVVDDAEAIGAETESIVREARDAGVSVRIVSGKRSGRTAAANIGLRAATGQRIHFHDDDDTVEPGFYRAALDFLDAKPRYRAVRAMCWRDYERIDGERIAFVKRRRIYPERRTVSLLDAAEVFAYPPIGSVWDRQTLVDIGGFDERFDVGEDYEMLLRFLLEADIGTIPELLAHVHVRPDASGAYSNSAIEQNFAEEQMLLMNALVRSDLKAGQFKLGQLLLLGRISRKRLGFLDYLDAARRRFLGF